MADTLSLDVERSALLIMDYQNSIVASYAARAEGLLDRTAAVLAAAREAGMRVIYIVVGFRPGFPEVSPNNKAFSAAKSSGRFRPGSSDSDVYAALAPIGEEPTVVKHRVGAFMGTDLEMILRAHDVRTLVMCGIATSGVVLSTLRYAADADYLSIVVKDCCADADSEVHACLMEKVFPRQATVITSDELIAALAHSGAA